MDGDHPIAFADADVRNTIAYAEAIAKKLEGMRSKAFPSQPRSAFNGAEGPSADNGLDTAFVPGGGHFMTTAFNSIASAERPPPNLTWEEILAVCIVP